jgi:S1-C subfamily serine protease
MHPQRLSSSSSRQVAPPRALGGASHHSDEEDDGSETTTTIPAPPRRRSYAKVAGEAGAESIATKEEIQSNVSDEFYHTIVRIVVHSTDFDFELPFKIKGNSVSSGTGFFITKQGHLLTCAHVVSSCAHVYVEIPNEGKRQYKARLLGVCPFFDLAVIQILGYQNKHCCQLEEVDQVKSGDETFALGFPLGQDNLKVTKGIISGQQLRMYQIDTPINPGNSGGPLLKNNKVIGVNGAGIFFANNIGYAVPISRYFLLKDKLHAKHQTLIHYPEVFGFDYQRTSKEFMEYFNHGTMGGIYVRRTFKDSPVSKTGMQEGDILCMLNGVNIDYYGEFEKRWMNQKMNLSNMLATLPLDQNVQIMYWSAKRQKMVRSHFKLTDFKLPIRVQYPTFETIPYEVLGGIVVMPLTLNHLHGMFVRGRVKKYMRMENRHEPRLIISSVLMGSYVATSKILKQNEIIKKLNDVEIKTMDDFRRVLPRTIRKRGRNYVTIVTENRNMVVIPVETILAEEAHLQSVYMYKSSPLLAQLKSRSRSSSTTSRSRSSSTTSRSRSSSTTSRSRSSSTTSQSKKSEPKHSQKSLAVAAGSRAAARSSSSHKKT